MGTNLRPLGPLTRIPVGGEHSVDDVVLCSNELAYVLSMVYLWDDVLNRPISLKVRVFTINPTTGALLSDRLLDLPVGFIFDVGQWKRLDDTTACFAGWDYALFRLGSGNVVFGTLHPTGDLVTHYHVPDTTTPNHIKGTGQILWVNTAERTGAIMHFPIYRYEAVSGFYLQFHTTATATSVNFDTGEAHHFAVTQNMGPNSNRTAWPQYYGTVPLPDGRVLAGRWAWDGDPDGPYGSVIGADMIDQNDRVIHRIRAADHGGTGFDGGFLFQVNGTTDMLYVYTISHYRPDVTTLWAQRYCTEPDMAPVGARLEISADANNSHYPGTDPYQLVIGSFIDSMDPFGGNLRVLNLPYLNQRNRAGDQSIYIGAQSSRDGSYAITKIDMPYPNDNPAYWTTLDTPTSIYGVSSRASVLYAFNWKYPPDGSREAVWFQLWSASTVGPAVRLDQRNDGLGIHGHPRLAGGRNGSSSTQLARAPRLGQRNRYS